MMKHPRRFVIVGKWSQRRMMFTDKVNTFTVENTSETWRKRDGLYRNTPVTHLKIWDWRERGEDEQVTSIRSIRKVRRMRREWQDQTGRMTQQDHLTQVYSSEREIKEYHIETMKIWACLSPAVFFWKSSAAKLQPWRWNLVLTVVPSQENRFQSGSRAAVSRLFAQPLISLCQLRPYQTWY